eukprot:TRINITY_DN9090_c0_g1_i1.p1 TRINITY_DN9090_c0_g1~~TRINITY_DN9090_c0_g1_i1.p1  ORF type:complete len:164 (-),score=26.39 TRINITY_DN9090_c0_g1_i1:34-525(-)
MAKCSRAGIPAPAVYLVEVETSSIYMEFVAGKTLKQTLLEGLPEPEVLRLCSALGGLLAQLHDQHLVHGDLTTSNMIVPAPGSAHTAPLVLIDFGLSYVSQLAEDKAVDLYVLERAFLSTHLGSQSLVSAVLTAYAQQCKCSRSVLPKLEQVRLRGRKRSMVG